MRTYAYIRSLGAEGLQDVSEVAVLNANYLLARLREKVGDQLPLAFGERCMHEFVLTGAPMKKELGIRTLDLAKRLLDHGMHPPTVYFPLVVDEALLIEPTETETRETLDAFVDAISADRRARRPPIPRSPATRPIRRRCGGWTRRARRSARGCARCFRRRATPRCVEAELPVSLLGVRVLLLRGGRCSLHASRSSRTNLRCSINPRACSYARLLSFTAISHSGSRPAWL